jgi:predicted exporter
LIGVAQDYGIYFFCKRLGANDELDSWRLLRQILPALILTLVTTLIGYFSLVLTPFPGLRQMALFSAVGLIFAWFTVVFWFPTLVRASSLKNRAAAERYGRSLTRWPRFAKNRRSLGTALAFAGLAGFGGSRLTVQDDIRSLQNPPKPLLDDQLKLGKILDLASPVQFFLLRGANAEVLLQREEASLRLDCWRRNGSAATTRYPIAPSAQMQRSRSPIDRCRARPVRLAAKL